MTNSIASVYAPLPSELESIPLGQEAATTAANENRATRVVETRVRVAFEQEVEAFIISAGHDDEKTLNRLRKPSKKLLRAAALYRRLSPIEFERTFVRLETVSVPGFSPSRLASAIDLVDRGLGTNDEEIQKEFRASEPADVRAERRRVEAQKIAGTVRVTVLGYCGDTFYYASNLTPEFIGLTPRQHVRSEFFRLAPIEYWENEYGTPGEHVDSKVYVDWDKVTSALMSAARNKGVIDPLRIRGRGAWLDGEAFVYNTGVELIYENGVRFPVVDVDSTYKYAAGVEILVGDEPLDDQSRRSLVDILGTFNWECRAHQKMVQGWILMAVVAGALPWRCLLWLTALAGSGKTTLLESVVRTVLGAATHFFKGSTTGRGIASVVKHDSVSFLLDEAEVGDERARDRMTNLLMELRATVSGSSGVRAVGSPGGDAKITRLESTGFLASINSCVADQADLQRILQPKLLPLDLSTDAARARASAARDRIENELNSAFSAGFLAFAVFNFSAIRRTIDAFADHFEPVFANRRRAVHFGTAFGCAFFLEFARSPSDAAEVSTWCEANDLSEKTLVDVENQKTESDAVLEIILMHKIQLIDGMNAPRAYSVADLLSASIRPGSAGNKIDRHDAIRYLEKTGIRLDLASSRLLIGRKHRAMLALFAKTSFGQNFVDALESLIDKDDAPFRKTKNFAGAGKSACSPIKLSKIVPLLGLEDESATSTDPDLAIAEELFKRLMSSEIRAYTIDDRQVQERIRDLIDAQTTMVDYPRVDQRDAGRALAAVGIVADRDSRTGEWTGDLLIAVDHPRLQDLLSRGGYAAGRRYVDVFKSIAIATKPAVLFGGVEYDALRIRDRR